MHTVLTLWRYVVLYGTFFDKWTHRCCMFTSWVYNVSVEESHRGQVCESNVLRFDVQAAILGGDWNSRIWNPKDGLQRKSVLNTPGLYRFFVQSTPPVVWWMTALVVMCDSQKQIRYQHCVDSTSYFRSLYNLMLHFGEVNGYYNGQHWCFNKPDSTNLTILSRNLNGQNNLFWSRSFLSSEWAKRSRTFIRNLFALCLASQSDSDVN